MNRLFAKTLVLLVSGALGALTVACPPMAWCDATTCNGTCDANGVCQPSDTSNHSAGGGTSSAGTGGGGGGATNTGGGGGSTVAQRKELVSGTRLRAVNMVGSDGSSAPAFFWDTQLQLYCTHAYGYSTLVGRCSPVNAAISWVYFADSSCSVPIAIDTSSNFATTSAMLIAAGLPGISKKWMTVSRDFGNTFTEVYEAVSYTGPVYVKTTSSSACAMNTLSTPMLIKSGNDISSTLARMTFVRE